MTPSFLILAWSAARGRDRAQQLLAVRAGQLDVVHQADNLIVLASADLPITRTADSTLLLLGQVHGQLPDVTGKGAATALRHLTRQTWGDYLALLRSPDACFAMVDPSGAGRAHLVADGDLVMVTDALSPTLMRSVGFAISVDLPALAGALVNPGTSCPLRCCGA